MGKFTDRFFRFPIKIYDGASLKEVLKKEDADISDVDDADWISGSFRMPGHDLHVLTWHDGFSRGRKVEEVNAEGFDLTMVFSPVHGEFACTWNRKKFEEELNKFMEQYEKESFCPGTHIGTFTGTDSGTAFAD